ncbi:hypothetical protein [Winogradskya humida]|uniref:Uncharacterized protein n=1 Tax=Winogradskya humida TaxID=113566 RepID=A0ABQ4A5B7_9ACTN|nr:hypothetical protein [Actinoplanes humidus]GIE26023.1 hypothetical protein Ahu01nite_091250 [Actinoplanes humidus]
MSGNPSGPVTIIGQINRNVSLGATVAVCLTLLATVALLLNRSQKAAPTMLPDVSPTPSAAGTNMPGPTVTAEPGLGTDQPVAGVTTAAKRPEPAKSRSHKSARPTTTATPTSGKAIILHEDLLIAVTRHDGISITFSPHSDPGEGLHRLLTVSFPT